MIFVVICEYVPALAGDIIPIEFSSFTKSFRVYRCVVIVPRRVFYEKLLAEVTRFIELSCR